MTRSFALPVLSGVFALVVGCGGDDGDEGDGDAPATVDSSDAAESAPTADPGDDAAEPAGSVEAEEPATGAEPAAVPTSGPEAIDPTTLEPGTAIVRVDGDEFRFARGDSIFDVCEFEPEFDFGQAKMDLVDGPEDGSPHLQIGYGADEQIVVLAVPPDIAYIAGKGAETDPYFQQFGVVPPSAGTIDVVDGGASGRTPMVKVLADELLEASFAVRC